MHDGFEMVARIPYPVTVPKFHAIASEVATMRFLRSSGLPVPEIYDYSPSSENAAKTEYIFMEFVRGTSLTDTWTTLDTSEVSSVLGQLVQLESRIMSIPFPAGGSLYYTKDLEKVAGFKGVPLHNENFCVGVDTRVHMWWGKRSQLDVDKGPYKSPEAALIAPARKEIAYLERFARPLLPFHRERRDAYDNEKQSPVDHIENLERYLRLVPSLIPKNPALHQFSLRHPDLQPSNIIVSRSPETNEPVIVGLLDWQHASILPLFLAAGIPERFQYHSDPVPQALTPPSLPKNLDGMEQEELNHAVGVYLHSLLHFHYVKGTEEYNELHYKALLDPLSKFSKRLSERASSPWEGETHALQSMLIEVAENWASLAGEGVECPIVFDREVLRKSEELSERLRISDENFETCRGMVGFEAETWVSNEHYSMATKLAELLKLQVLMNIPRELQDNVEANWYLNDMDESDYL
ncbi:hypothetical protein SISNIDRAFT_418731 [Sistotremastrum niveocremeum HHB9708]|uniref:Aminoglycoside phosphotransferase domain-containing protein n=1 Tax=Sistotremastrum niveocremeum HHB9708 TaxID=1314777 RepID=A0A164NXM0_9AGAM|nr:hypothetical protein SISNIDRAFT_418731 [Sistotremastrum niveocremeum HHB9708]